MMLSRVGLVYLVGICLYASLTHVQVLAYADHHDDPVDNNGNNLDNDGVTTHHGECLSEVSSSEDLDAALGRFESWLHEKGATVNPAVRVGSSAGRGHGVLVQQQAENSLREGTTVLDIPLRSVLSREVINSFDAKDRNAAGLVLANAKGLDNDKHLIAAFIAVHSVLGERSDWAPYLAVLPQFDHRDIISGWQMDQAALEALQDPMLANTMRRFREDIGRVWDSVRNVAIRSLRAQLAQLAGLEDVQSAALEAMLSLERYEWAMALVDSRALMFNSKAYLVPFADMFNYSPHPLPRRSNRGAFFLNHHVKGTNSLKVKADRETRPGDELVMDYGDNPSFIYLQHHGFVPKHNPFDCLLLFPTAIPPAGSPQRTLLENLRLLQPNLFVCVRWSSALSELTASSLLYFERAASLSKSQASQCLADLESGRANDFKQIAHRCLANARLDPKATMLRLLEGRSRALGATSASQDHALLQSETNRGVRLALSYRIAQKHLLADVLAFVRDGVAPEFADLQSFEVPGVSQAGRLLDSELKSNAQKLKRLWSAEKEMTLESKVARLNAWAEQMMFPVCKIKAAVVPDFRVGTIATSTVAAEEPYLVVPPHASMDLGTAARSRVFPWLQHIADSGRTDELHELIFFLIFERFVMGPLSNWWSYISLLPDSSEMLMPLFYNQEEIGLLSGHWIKDLVLANQHKAKQSFKAVSGFLSRTFSAAAKTALPQAFAAALTEENYLWAHAILDSRSIWWAGSRHLVPMLDMVNCKSGLDRVHKTVDGDSGAVTKAPNAVTQGDQLFEDYGQPNHIYFLFHGFSLQGNGAFDCFKINLDVQVLSDMQRAVIQRYRHEKQLTQQHGLQPNEFCLRAPLDSSEANGDLFAGLNAEGNKMRRDQQLAAVQKELRAKLASFPSTIEQDVEHLDALLLQPGKEKASNALRFLITEKRLLQSLLHA